MDTEPGRTLIVWTVRLGVTCYLAAVWSWLVNRFSKSERCVAFRRLWTFAWLLVVVHVLCAFHFQHRWSHQAALKHTAEMTERVVGWYWSGGLYINYVFLAFWEIDIRMLWRKSQMQPLPATKTFVAMRSVTAFMVFNATAVFGPKWWIAVTAVFLVALTVGRCMRYPKPGQ